jgi:hypothetical protein
VKWRVAAAGLCEAEDAGLSCELKC